jgi:ankyrin repeat protein
MCTADVSIEEYTEEGLAHSQNVQQCVSVLLDKGVPVDCQDPQGRTPLHCAVQLPSKSTTDTVRGRHFFQFRWRSLPCISNW